MAIRYQVGPYLQQVSTLLGIETERVLRRLGLSADLSNDAELSVGTDAYLRLFDAAIAEANRPGAEMELAMAYAHSPFVPPIFAFSCAETLSLGLSRLADFKPLIGPIAIEVSRPNHGLHVEITVTDPQYPMSPSLGLFELLYIVECARSFTGTHVVPVQTSLSGPLELEEAYVEHLGGTPKTSGVVSITFSPEDADRPLITRSPSFWQTIEPGFLEQLEERLGTATMSDRIKKALVEALPGGSTSVDDMAQRLNVSKRSLQRRLSEEGTSFQELLNSTRYEMSERYLKDSGLSVPEISYLLGFRDTSSFFRAFHGWTGTTPGDFRANGPAQQGVQLH